MFSLFGDYRKKMQDDKKREKQGDTGSLFIVLLMTSYMMHLSLQGQFFHSLLSKNEYF